MIAVYSATKVLASASVPAAGRPLPLAFDALEAANGFTIEGGTLSIYGGESWDPLRFAHATP